MSSLIQLNTKLFTDPKYHDVEFIFPKEEGRLLKANKCFLAENSEVWEKMFCGENWKDSGKTETIVQITIEDAKYEMFEIFLKYCYTKAITFTQDNVLSILLISETYMHKELIERADSYIMDQDKDFDFKLRILGEMNELGEIEIESVLVLKEDIKIEIIVKPDSFLWETNFSNLSPAIMDTICDLFSQETPNLHESYRLSRIIEYGKALKKHPDYADKKIEEILAPFKKYINIMELNADGIRKLIKYSLITYEEACNNALDIMEKNFINTDTLGKSKKLEFNRVTFQGSMMDRLNINPNTDLKTWEKDWCLDINSNTELKITLIEPLIINYIICKLQEPYEGTVIEISYSKDETDWKVNSLHYPSYDTRRINKKHHRFYIKRSAGVYQYWKICGKSSSNTILGKNLQIFIAE